MKFYVQSPRFIAGDIKALNMLATCGIHRYDLYERLFQSDGFDEVNWHEDTQRAPVNKGTVHR